MRLRLRGFPVSFRKAFLLELSFAKGVRLLIWPTVLQNGLMRSSMLRRLDVTQKALKR